MEATLKFVQDPGKLLGDPIGGRFKASFTVDIAVNGNGEGGPVSGIAPAPDTTGNSVAGIGLDVMNDIITRAYGRPMVWALYSIDVPKASLLKEVKELHDQAVWSNVRKGKLHLLFIDGESVWGDLFARNSLRVLDFPKVAKRMAGLMSARALSDTFDSLDTFQIKVVPQDAFATPQFLEILRKRFPKEKEYAEALEKILDGAGVIRRSRIDAMYNMWRDRVTGVYHGFQIDSMARRFEEAIMVNGRCFTPNGVLKGNWFAMDDDVMDAMYGRGTDLVVPEGSYKDGVYTDTEVIVTAEVQQWHEDVNNNVQVGLNTRQMHTDKFNTENVEDFFLGARDKVKDGTVLDNVANIMADQADAVQSMTLSSKLLVDLGTRWSAAEWVASGLDIRQSPSLLTGTAAALTRRVIKSDPKTGLAVDYKVPQPCAWYMQLISESASRMYGFKAPVVNGEARVWWGGRMIVISDEDYVDHYMRFGGCDLDDFFQVFFRTYQGEKTIIALRSPNGWGEYGTFKFHEGDKYPKWEKNNGDVVEFPIVKGTLPLQLDKALIKFEDLKGEIKDNMSVLLPLHKDLHVDQQNLDAAYTKQPITREDGWKRVVAAVETAVSAGMMVNAVMFYYMVMRKHIPITFGVLETFIDLTTQDDLHPEDAARLRFLAHWLVNFVVQSGRPLDELFVKNRNIESMIIPTSVWERHNFQAWAKDPSLWVADDALDTMAHMWAKHKEPLPKLNFVSEGQDAFFSVRLRHTEELAQKFRSFSQEIANAATPPDGLMEVGDLTMGNFGAVAGGPRGNATGMAWKLRDFRKDMAQAWWRAKNATDENGRPIPNPRIPAEEYQKMFSDMFSYLTSFEGRKFNNVTQYNRVLGMAAASYKYRVSNLRCQYKGCNEEANVPYTHRGVKYQVCRGHNRILKGNSTKRSNLEVAKFNDNAVTNREVFQLYMDAMRFFGIAAELGKIHYDDGTTEVLSPTGEWSVICEGDCGRSAVITDRVKYQKFVTQRSHCIVCFTAKQAQK